MPPVLRLPAISTILNEHGELRGRQHLDLWSLLVQLAPLNKNDWKDCEAQRLSMSVQLEHFFKICMPSLVVSIFGHVQLKITNSSMKGACIHRTKPMNHKQKNPDSARVVCTNQTKKFDGNPQQQNRHESKNNSLFEVVCVTFCGKLHTQNTSAYVAHPNHSAI